MPIYEYRCEPCSNTFETLVRNTSDVPKCPQCGSIDLNKQFSVPASAHTGSTSRPNTLPIAPQGPGCGAPMCCGGGCDLD
ncbi:MAG TPA: zinc ribbon domain-containing protein [Isosphaeraceae bacterium]|nr:zinc ribbon domain-containing protein [Isosphaeraceae bacterium]